MRARDTIVAISTPPGRGGLGVVRLSGAEAKRIALAVVRFRHPPEWQSWSAALAELPGPDGEAVDHVIVTYFAAPRSYTAEDVVEISCHGSPVVLRYCMERACSEGARLAEPGEFTLRAFLNGRIDLARAEAVRDLIEATTLYQARVAAQQVEGSVSRRIAPIKERLLELVALLEAGIDFAEDDIETASTGDILGRVDALAGDLDKLRHSFAYGRLVHDGLTLAIVGRPNVGKSSLFNRLLERERAIVTEIPGTTRDLVSETAALGGIPVKFVDTAGIRAGAERVEALGVERSYQAMGEADLTLVVIDLAAPLEEVDLELARRPGAIVAANKSDLERAAEPPEGAVVVSALTGDGIDELRQRIFDALAPAGGPEHEPGFITSARHAGLLEECAQALGHARAAAESGFPHEMILLDLYAALQPIDAITGATTADDILNRIFSTFCIGK